MPGAPSRQHRAIPLFHIYGCLLRLIRCTVHKPIRIEGIPTPSPTPIAIWSLSDSPDPLDVPVEAEGAVLLVGVATTLSVGVVTVLLGSVTTALLDGVATALLDSVATVLVVGVATALVVGVATALVVGVATGSEALPALGAAVPGALATLPTKTVDVAVTSPTGAIPAPFGWLHVSKMAAMSPLNRAEHVFETLYQSKLVS